MYYRCANNRKPADHPVLRWRAENLVVAILQDLESMKMPSPEMADWFKKALVAVFADADNLSRQQRRTLTKRKTELANMQDRLLNGYLSGMVGREMNCPLLRSLTLPFNSPRPKAPNRPPSTRSGPPPAAPARPIPPRRGGSVEGRKDRRQSLKTLRRWLRRAGSWAWAVDPSK